MKNTSSDGRESHQHIHPQRSAHLGPGGFPVSSDGQTPSRDVDEDTPEEDCCYDEVDIDSQIRNCGQCHGDPNCHFNRSEYCGLQSQALKGCWLILGRSQFFASLSVLHPQLKAFSFSKTPRHSQSNPNQYAVDCLTCNVCTEILKDPVSLGCHHNFCSSCLQDFWAQAENKNCPVCKRKSSKEIGINFSLKELADSFAGRQRSAPSEEAQVVCTETSQRSAPSEEAQVVCTKPSQRSDPSAEAQVVCTEPSQRSDPSAEAQVVCTEPSQRSGPTDEAQVVCTEHLKDIKWFCKDEQRAVCPVCEFPHHQGHRVVPLEEQVQELKQQLRPDLRALQARRSRHQELEETYEAMVPHLKGQRVKTERGIRKEFEQLHRFLREEEEARVAALGEEEEQKRKRILLERKTLQEQIRSLSEGLSAVEADLQKDGLSFLSASTRSRTSARALLSGSDPQLLPGALLDEAKHLGNLAHRVWEKIGQRTTFSPVTLDPNTATRSLSLSDDLTSVRRMDVNQMVPNNPERFTRYRNVLGSEGFSSGEHCWEVEVGDLPIWRIGVAKESVERRGEHTASPANGIWCLFNDSGKYTQGTGQTLTLKRTPERIRVQLDYDGGEVSFYDPEDMTLIYTHQHTFTDNIFPWFSLGAAGEARTKAVRVCGVSSRTKPCK